jgi:heat shock protein HtpX
MVQVYGLYGHIRANRIRSAMLLAGFVVLLQALQLSLYLLLNAFFEFGSPFETILRDAFAMYARTWPLATGLAIVWFVVAWFAHHALIRMATGAKPVERRSAPQLYNALENLCVSRGMVMPRLEIIETPGLNAYAAGLREGDYVVAVTRGLLDTLSPAELEAVLAHELTHIQNRDTQLMVVAVIFAGIFAFFGDMIARPWDFPYGISPRSRRDTRSEDSGGWTWQSGGSSRDRDERSDRGGGNATGALIAIAVAIVVILITWGVSTLIRFALSRSREYLADAGAVELTKNPDAMVSALRKIAANPKVEVISRMEAFFIETPIKERLNGILSTHPHIEDRIAALQKYAGAAAPAAQG